MIQNLTGQDFSVDFREEKSILESVDGSCEKKQRQRERPTGL